MTGRGGASGFILMFTSIEEEVIYMRYRAALLAAGTAVAGLAAAASIHVLPAEAATTTPTKVLVIVEENHGLTASRAGMPYLASLGNKYAYGTQFFATTHPSLPNYLAIAGGDSFGVSTNSEPVPSPKVGQNSSVFGQGIGKGKTAKVYNESMIGNCSSVWQGGYVTKHNPWPYFGKERTLCRQFDIPATTFLANAAASTLPNAGMLIPNLSNDAHNGTLAKADSWLKARLPTVLASSDFTSGRLTVIVTFDEDSNNQIFTVVMNAGMTKHGAIATRLNHYAITGYYEHVLGAPLLRNATTGLAPAFGLR